MARVNKVDGAHEKAQWSLSQCLISVTLGFELENYCFPVALNIDGVQLGRVTQGTLSLSFSRFTEEMEVPNSIPSVKGDFLAHRTSASLRFSLITEEGQILRHTRAAVAGTSLLLGRMGKNLRSFENLPHSCDSWEERQATPEISFALGLNVPW